PPEFARTVRRRVRVVLLRHRTAAAGGPSARPLIRRIDRQAGRSSDSGFCELSGNCELGDRLGQSHCDPAVVAGSAAGTDGSLRPLSAKRGEWVRPKRAARNSSAVPSTPRPYFTLRRKSIDEASGKYRAGHEISPM